MLLNEKSTTPVSGSDDLRTRSSTN